MHVYKLMDDVTSSLGLAPRKYDTFDQVSFLLPHGNPGFTPELPRPEIIRSGAPVLEYVIWAASPTGYGVARRWLRWTLRTNFTSV